jgi:hypothetical protein
MARVMAILVPLALVAACELPGTGSRDDGPGADVPVQADANVQADTTAQPDTATGPCTTHRDCFTQPSDKFACDPATGACVTPRLYFMPCDTDNDCGTYYNTSLKKCGPAKVCASPCFNPGQAIGDTCPYGNRTCGFQSVCACANDAACGNDQVCSTVAAMCMGKCQQDLDCVSLTGTTCDVPTGQCVK